MTLFQYDKKMTDVNIREMYYNLAQEFNELMFLGLVINEEVCVKILNI